MVDPRIVASDDPHLCGKGCAPAQPTKAAEPHTGGHVHGRAVPAKVAGPPIPHAIDCWCWVCRPGPTSFNPLDDR